MVPPSPRDDAMVNRPRSPRSAAALPRRSLGTSPVGSRSLVPPQMDKGRGISRNSVTTITGVSFQGDHVSDFGSDLGRKKFGFSREELETPGAYYEGQFKLYQRSGYGTIFFPDNGERYMGQFSSDLYHGEGLRVWADGSEYRGQWSKGQKSGKGEYVSPESLRYVGQWESGRRHGQWCKGQKSGKG